MAPADNQWRHEDSDSGNEDMSHYIEYRELDAEGNPVVQRRRRRRRVQRTPEPNSESEEAVGQGEQEKPDEEPSSNRSGKEVAEESSDSESTDSDAPPRFDKYQVRTGGKLNLVQEQSGQGDEESDLDHYETHYRAC